MIAKVDKSILEVHDLTVSYHNKPVLWNIDFDLPAGIVAGIVGPNGAGKSTLIKSIMGLIEPDQGYAKIFGKELDEVRSKVSYVPQRESVDWDFPASVMDVVLMGRYGRRGFWSRYNTEDRKIAKQSLEQVDMLPFAKRQISQLSGGQQQRVFLARALAQQADVYLMDEPFAGVDAATEASILTLLKKMSEEGKTMIVVHHDLQSAYDYFDWMILLNRRLIAVGPKVDVFTDEFIQETYGGNLSILSTLGNIMRRKP